MIKRPLSRRFNEAVLDGRKFTTIRDKPWPVGVPIMLYNWTGAPYRSKHVNVVPVIVMGFWSIFIRRFPDETMLYAYGMENSKPLYESEGFESQKELDGWFRQLVEPGNAIVKTLMRFRLLPPELRTQR